MAVINSGSLISANDINTILRGLLTQSQFSINDPLNRALTLRTTANTTISFSDFYDRPTTFLPNAPMIGTATRVNTTQVTVSYTPSTYNGNSTIIKYIATAYIGATATALTGEAASGTITVSGLVIGTTYTFKVKAVNGVGIGPESTASNSVTMATIPGPPTNVSASISGTSVTVIWDPPNDTGGSPITNYRVSIVGGGGSYTTNSESTRSYSISGFAPGEIVTLSVAAYNAIMSWGNEQNSNTVQFPTPATPPTIGTSVVNSFSQITVNWSPGSAGSYSIIGYQVYNNVTGGITPVGIATSIAIPNLSPGTTYTFKVLAKTSGGNTGYSGNSAAATTLATTPSPPTIGTATTGAIYSQATLTWTAPSSNGGSAITNHRIKVWDGWDNLVNPVIYTASSATSAIITGLAKGANYAFSVAATNSAGVYSTDSNKSNTILTHGWFWIREDSGYIDIPVGPTQIYLYCIGGGGGGSGGGGGAGSGGGGGGYAYSLVNIPSNRRIYYSASNTFAGAGVNGGDSWISTTNSAPSSSSVGCLARGGQAGGNNVGGAGGDSRFPFNIGTTAYLGGNGGATYGGGGGAGGMNGNGGNGGNGVLGANSSQTFGGGGGASGSAGGAAGANATTSGGGKGGGASGGAGAAAGANGGVGYNGCGGGGAGVDKLGGTGGNYVYTSTYFSFTSSGGGGGGGQTGGWGSHYGAGGGGGPSGGGNGNKGLVAILW